MQFNSFEYILFFLPCTLAMYLAFRTSVINKYIILIASCVFYGWVHPWFLLPMALSAFVDYYLAKRIENTDDAGKRKLYLVVSVVFSLSLMCFFKYTEWLTRGLVDLAPILGVSIISAPVSLVLPPGISFYTFETISYTADVYRKEVQARKRLLDYLQFIVFFPHLVAGPIRRAKDLLPALSAIRPVVSWKAADQAIFFIVWGLVLKTVFADNFGAIVEYISNDIKGEKKLAAGVGLIYAYSFAFQIYCDFAAYSFIARGSALLFGVDVHRNFKTPYFSSNPSEFWQRWHISLSTWLRDYLYIPLGGNQYGLAKTARNLLIVMTLGGLWHGAGIFFILWGLWHGLLLVMYRVFPLDEWLTSKIGFIGKVVAIFLFFHLVCFGWILFRSSVQDFPIIMQSVFATRPAFFLPWSEHWLFSYGGPTLQVGWWFALLAAPIAVADFVGYRRDEEFPDIWSSLNWVLRVLLLVAMFYAVIFFAARQANEFIYFAF